jgi:putative serine protease PepD
MAEDDPRSDGVGDSAWSPEQSDSRYRGPYDQPGSGGPDPLSIGSWAEDTRPIPPAGPSFAAHDQSAYPAPGGVPPLPSRTPAQAAFGYAPPSYSAPNQTQPNQTQPNQTQPNQTQPNYPQPNFPSPDYPPPNHSQPGQPPGAARKQRRPVRAGTVIAVAAITALLIGGGAGYAGSRLAERTTETSAPAASSSVPAPTPQQQTPSPSASRTSVAPAPNTLDAVKVAAAALPSAVMIRVGSGDDGSIGSGFVLDASGLIMTNNHVVADAAEGQRLRVVFSDGTVAGASLVGRSPTYDIAVIRVKTAHALVPMPIGDSDATQVGESVLAIGSPLGLPGTVTEGIVSARNRPVAVGSDGPSANAYINGTQTDAPINPGNSGGPLLDAGGRVIGVNSAILTLGADRQQAGNIGLGFAIPINQAMEIGKLLIADGKATYPVIGADVADSGDLAGVRLSSVTGNGPADRAGLRKDDVVTKIDGQRVSATEELIVAVRSHRPGDRVTLTYQRNGQAREAEVTLGSREG